MTTNVAKVAGISAGAALLGLGIPYFIRIAPPQITSFITDLPVAKVPLSLSFLKNNTGSEPVSTKAPFSCDTSHSYRTELVSLDPLIIYIHNLITPTETTQLLLAGEPEFAPSKVTKGGRQQNTKERTSSSAGLPEDNPTVQCVLKRARNFLGNMFRDGWDEMGQPQLVRYTTGQQFTLHHDWFASPLWADDGSWNTWNRLASFFVILEDDCTGGETYFPFAKSIVAPGPKGEQPGITQRESGGGEQQKPLWREHEDGGLAFRPVAGNSLFWINLHPNGTGDTRTKHAGLPLESGQKTAMNIWPRQYYAYE
ncbi:uncharacterized protein PODANS_1_5450 [Podospora anserina S mat+]|uniref:Podospora anserina S mat+ genomic DNA chromosome 1, supercontig 1 n=1 Tax=Podospora anserina (strain S / ATCC MYA-4624 / DSM 980 / FGSC 10383) TaxID=515849 RepID=B2AAX0_PODAN|nr:uncharacterized protein PODANS_1_5450 [Podospora anserina S mat+]CAP60232.1 unnamed protein product [Podospora anserina S mat+]CDP22872.1 Putative protein of unknown function [Podospora anserina S mat+]